MESGIWNLVHSDLRPTREARERLPHDSPPLHSATESERRYPVREDQRHDREEPEQLPPLHTPMTDARP